MVYPSGIHCSHHMTDGTIDCPHCGRTASEFISEAREYLDDHVGDVVSGPGYMDD